MPIFVKLQASLKLFTSVFDFLIKCICLFPFETLKITPDSTLIGKYYIISNTWENNLPKWAETTKCISKD